MNGKCGNLRDARAALNILSQLTVFPWNVMPGAYIRNGHLVDARRLFDTVPARDLGSWNAMIAAHTQNGSAKVALQLFRQMELAGVRPDKITFIKILNACVSWDALADGKLMHARIVDAGFDGDRFLANHLVKMYGKCGNLEYARGVFNKIRHLNGFSWNLMIVAYAQNGYLEDARILFDKMPVRDVVSWNAMIAAYARNEHGKRSLELFSQMKLEGLKPDKITLISILNACASTAALEEGKVIHASIVSDGIESDVVVGTALLKMYGKCGSLEDARNVFDKMPLQDMVSRTAMIAAYAHNGQGMKALELFRQIDLKSTQPDKITFSSILDACASLLALEEGKAIHSIVVNYGFQTDVVVGTSLVDMYGKCGSVEDARSVFDNLSRRDAVCWNAMIVAYAQNGNDNGVLESFQQMELEGVKPDKITFVSILHACASLASLRQGRAIHAYIINTCESDLVVGTALINMYGNCGNLGDARSVFDEMPQRDVVSWNSMITVYSQNGHLEGARKVFDQMPVHNVVSWNAVIAAYTANGYGKGAIELFQQMDMEGVKPNNVTLISILDACAILAALGEGKEIHANIIDSHLESDVVVGTALVNMYGKCGSVEDARNVFDKILQRDVVSWNAMIAAYAQNGHGKLALELFQQMTLGVVKPDEITFISILSACSHAGLLDDAWHCFVCMNRDHGIIPIMDHYVCMIDLLGRAGQLDRAEVLINWMPFEPDTVAWTNLLAACRVHGDVERGVRAAENIYELDPKNAAPYILLSHIYAAAGRWDDMSKLRKVMQDRGIEKPLGHSCIEVKNCMHEFVLGGIASTEGEDIS